MLEAAKQSITSITPRASITRVKCLLRDQHVQDWNDILDELTVQNKFKDVLTRRITHGTVS